METSVPINSKMISIDTLLSFRHRPIRPMDGVNIPNITVPPNLVSKKRPTEADDSIATDIRKIFNSTSTDAIADAKDQLRQVVYSKAHKVEILSEISDEVFKNFLVSEKNIKNYMHLLNSIGNTSILVQGPTNTRPVTIGFHFVNKCRITIFGYIAEENIRRLGGMDEYDPDEQDVYNGEREKILNLIITICYLYEQRNSTLVKVTSSQIYSVIKAILEMYNKYIKLIKSTWDPNDPETGDEDEYYILKKMASLYFPTF